MWPSLVDYLACPSCNKSDLLINITKKREAGYIDEGDIMCLRCGKNYLIYNGIPLLLADLYEFELEARNLFEPSPEHLGYSLEPTKKVAQLLQKHEVNIALDVACGLGVYTAYFKCNTLVSFDISPYFVMKCAEKEGRKEGRHFLVADIMNMPFKDDTFDLIFASSILEHLKPLEVSQVIARFNNILKKGGIIQIDVPNTSILLEFLRKIMTRLGIYRNTEFKENPELGHHSFFVQKDLEKFGFEVHGCIGWVTRHRLPLGILWELYDLIGWYIPSLAGTLIGLKKVTKT